MLYETGHLTTATQEGNMAGRFLRLALCLMVTAALTAGCAAAVVGTAAVGTGAGTYLFINGELKTDYYAPFEKVWAAAEKTVAAMHGQEVVPSKAIGSGTIKALIDGEKVTINILFKEKALTTVGVRVGVLGDEPASKMIHAKIADNIKK